MKKIAVFLLTAFIAVGFMACNGHQSEIDTMKKNLMNSERGKPKGAWVTEYDYEDFEGADLKVREYLTLEGNDKFKELREYYYNGNLLATCELSGEWDIDYDDDDEAFYFDQDYSDKSVIKNVGFTDEWFKKFDTDLRLTLNGDVATANEVYDEDTLFGTEIIDCTPSLFLVKILHEDMVLRYEKSTRFL